MMIIVTTIVMWTIKKRNYHNVFYNGIDTMMETNTMMKGNYYNKRN